MHGTRLARVTFEATYWNAGSERLANIFPAPARFISGKVFRLVGYQRCLRSRVHVRTCTRTHRKSIRSVGRHPRKKRRERGKNTGNMREKERKRSENWGIGRRGRFRYKTVERIMNYFKSLSPRTEIVKYSATDILFRIVTFNGG